MRVYTLITWFMIGVSSICMAQELQFDVTTYDFGEVNEEGGAVTHTFSFVNKGDEPIQISSVQASCGCTTPQWTKEAIQPGDSGSITAEYNPLNRPGKFDKSLAVHYKLGSKPSTTTLYIEGLVKPKPKTIEDELPTLVGNLRVKYRSLNMGKMTNKELVVQRFDVYNDGDSAINWLDSIDSPDYIQITFDPQTLNPKDLGAIVVTYDPKKKDDFGFVTDNVMLLTDESKDSRKLFSVIATIQEYFPEMTAEELARAPRLTFDRTQHDFGSVTLGNKVITEFTLTNTGKEELNIRKTKPNCGCTISVPEKETIAPGESVKMKVSFDTSGRRGRQYKTVTVFTNDPTAPSQMISIKADIKD